MKRAEKKDVTITTWKTKGGLTLSIVARDTTEVDAWDGGQWNYSVEFMGKGGLEKNTDGHTLSTAWVHLLHVVKMAELNHCIEWKRTDKPPQPSNGATHVHTAHFISFDTACDYYEPYGMDAGAVGDKVRAGEISIGAPVGAIGVNEEGRYVVSMEG